jgi:hypothetical protein
VFTADEHLLVANSKPMHTDITCILHSFQSEITPQTYLNYLFPVLRSKYVSNKIENNELDKGDQIKMDEMSGACSKHGKDRKCTKISRKSEGKRPLGRSGLR